jgi:four helix bundle protein
MPVKSFRDLVVWQRSLDFIEEAYRVSQRFPADERFGLTSQLRRAAVSVAANIAEGSGRFTSRDYLNFISESRGSVKEAESHLLVGARLKFVAPADIDRGLGFADEISRMLFNLRLSIRRDVRKAGT